MLICGGEGNKNQYETTSTLLCSGHSLRFFKALNPRRIITPHNNVPLLINNVPEMMEAAFKENLWPEHWLCHKNCDS